MKSATNLDQSTKTRNDQGSADQSDINNHADRCSAQHLFFKMPNGDFFFNQEFQNYNIP